MNGLLRLEAAGVARARLLGASVLAAGSLVLLFAALASRESSILAFTGFARVVTGVGLAALFLGPLLSLFATVQVVPAARQQGVLEWYLSHPVSRDQCFWALWTPRAAAVAGPMIVAVLGLAIAARLLGDVVPLDLLLRLAAILGGQVLCFTALGMAVSVTAPSAEQALLRGIVLWMASAALLDFALVGAMLRWNVPPHLVFAISALNPVQAGRLGLLAGGDAELGVLGPVGTWITVTLGPGLTTAYALGWPVLLGGIALGLARAVFRRRDLL